MNESGEVRSRILTAAVDEAGEVGLSRLSVDGVARRAGVGRATVYRHFPGGKEQLTSDAVIWEVAHYFTALEKELILIDGLAERLERGIIEGRRLMAEHAVLQKVVGTEPERLLPHLSQSAPLVQAAVREHLRQYLADAPLRSGVDVEDAADFLARNVLSFLMASGSWDLDDPVAVKRLVRDNLLAGVIES